MARSCGNLCSASASASACVWGGLHDTVCFRGLAAKPRAFPRGLVRPKLGGLGPQKKPEEAPDAASQPHAEAEAAHSAAIHDTVHGQPPSAKILKVSALCLILYTNWARTLTFQNFCQTPAPQTSALVAAANAGGSAHAQELPPGNAPAPQSSRETQPETRGAPGGGGNARPAHAPEPTPASPRPSPRPSSAAPAPSVSAAAPSVTADAVAPTQAGPRNK
jgi:hypothetical protein